MLQYPEANNAKIIHNIPFCFLWENKGKNTYKMLPQFQEGKWRRLHTRCSNYPTAKNRMKNI
jgi:hypothetical protein